MARSRARPWLGVFGLPLYSGHVLAIGPAMWPIRELDEFDSAGRQALDSYEKERAP